MGLDLFFSFYPQILPLDSYIYDPLVSILFSSNDADSDDGNVVCMCVLEEGAGFTSHNFHLRHFRLLTSKGHYVVLEQKLKLSILVLTIMIFIYLLFSFP